MKRCLYAVIFCLVSLSGCKVVIIAPPHVAIVSGDMTFMCLPGETCELDVSDYEFDLSLYAVPKPGYRFLYWSAEPEHLCPGFFSNKCHISTRSVDPNNEEFRNMLQSPRVFYLEPVYRRDETAPPINWETLEGG